MTSEPDRAVETTAALYGIDTSWVDVEGNRRTASDEVVLAVLRRLGAPVDGATDLADAVRHRRRSIWERVCPPVRVVGVDESPTVPLRLPAERARGPLRWSLALEPGAPEGRSPRPGGDVRAGEARVEQLALAGGGSVEGRRFEIRRLEVPAGLIPGYHRLTIRHGATELRSRVIVAPPVAFRDGGLEGRWGVSHPLYGLRCARAAAGVGDFRTLREAAAWTSVRGGAVFGTTPLVALFADEPIDPSPYAPASRLFWDDRYVELEAAPGYVEAREAGELEALDALDRQRSAGLVPWRELSRGRDLALSALARRFFARGGDRSARLLRFLAARPEAGEFARFLVARETWGADWRHWPEPARSGRLPADLLDRSRVRRYLFGQWLAAEQLEPHGPDAALYLDVPLGTHPDGYDVWSRRTQFATEVAAGAPPDEFFRGGQNWGLPPLHPERIREDGFAYFAAALRHAMRPSGLVRIDHVMQLHRLFWIPAGADPADGVYVRYPADELAGVVALESHRARCEVAGEDLGTVPEAVRELMDRRGIRRTHVLGFGLEPVASSGVVEAPPGAVATTGTHDMVPLAGLRAMVDLDEREALGLLPVDDGAELRARRAEVFRRLDERYGVAPIRPAGTGPDPLLRPLLGGLGTSRAGLVVVPLDDLFGSREPQNIPGTVTERPNWRRRLPASLDRELSDEAERALAGLRSAREGDGG